MMIMTIKRKQKILQDMNKRGGKWIRRARGAVISGTFAKTIYSEVRARQSPRSRVRVREGGGEGGREGEDGEYWRVGRREGGGGMEERR